MSLKATFWGVRGSYPVPGPSTVKYGGNTSCVEIDANGHKIIIDAGTGIIGLGNKIMKDYFQNLSKDKTDPITLTLLLSHTHHDHTQGFPYFPPSFLGNSIIYLFGPRTFHEDIHDTMAKAMLAPFHPVDIEEFASLRAFHHISESEIIFFSESPEISSQPRIMNKFRDKESNLDMGVKIKNIKSYAHPKTGVYIYRIEVGDKSIVYATDTEGYVGGDKRIIDFARGADILIHDGQYTTEQYLDKALPKQGWGHSTYTMAAEIAKEAGVGQLFLFHHDPSHNDEKMDEIEKETQKIFKNSYAAKEGFSIEI